MTALKVRYLAASACAAAILTACVTAAPPTGNHQPTPSTITEVGPTPLPVRSPHPPGELFEYVVQSGDTLIALASHFNTTVDEILDENPDLSTSTTTLPPGYPMLIPAYYVPLTGSPFHIVPDSEVIYGPSVIGFDISHEIRLRPGFLNQLSDFAYRRQRDAWGVVDIIARNYSINPRLLLALMEYQTQALTKPFAEDDEATYPMGVRERRYADLFWQLIWAGERLNDGYYGWRSGTLKEFELADGLLVRPDPWLNAGTVAVQYLFAGVYGKEQFDRAVGPEGFYLTFQSLWGDPLTMGVTLIPANLQQPELSLPFVPNRIWGFTSGPHYAWGTSMPLGAVDFAPPAEEGGCVLSAEWIAAPADGVIARSAEAVVILDLDGDGDERTGWVLFFYHVGSNDRIEEGEQVRQGDLLGHPSCEGGRATGTHFHLARRFNGEWIAAGGTVPLVMDQWVVANGEEPYQGAMTKGSKMVPANEVVSAVNRIIYEIE
jgi:LysM repeat protein